MKRVLFLPLLAVASQLSVFAQGPLTPPGPPGPTMLTLNQIEPRMPITNLPVTILSPGSYYVTTNLTCTTCTNGQNGITFATSPLTGSVTVDLSGYSLAGVAGSGSGVALGIGRNNVIRNGVVRSWGVDGVTALTSLNCRFEGLQLYANANFGLESGVGSVVVNCEATSNTVGGISLAGGEISHCVAVNNSGIGILASNGCVVTDCSASGNSIDGINVGAGAVVSSCASYANSSNGVTAASNCTIKDCTASADANGIVVGGNCAVIGCTASSNVNINGIAARGIYVAGNNCTVKDCTAGGNGNGIYITGNNCTVIGCTTGGNSFNGIVVEDNNCTVKDCTAGGNVYDGITVSGNDCQIVGNTCGGNSAIGIEIFNGIRNWVNGNTVGNNSAFGIADDTPNATNSITRNSASGNRTAGYSNYAGNNDYAPTGSVHTATNPWTNF